MMARLLPLLADLVIKARNVFFRVLAILVAGFTSGGVPDHKLLRSFIMRHGKGVQFPPLQMLVHGLRHVIEIGRLLCARLKAEHFPIQLHNRRVYRVRFATERWPGTGWVLAECAFCFGTSLLLAFLVFCAIVGEIEKQGADRGLTPDQFSRSSIVGGSK